MESVYSTLFLDSQKLRNFLISVKDEADGRCLMDMYIVPDIARECYGWACPYSTRGLCKFARSTEMGNAKASDCRMSNSTDLAFSV